MGSVTPIVLAAAFGIVSGLLLNIFFPDAVSPIAHSTLAPIGRVVLRLLQFVVVPILFCSVVFALQALTSTGKLVTYLRKLAIIYVTTSTVAVAMGVAAFALLRPGGGTTVRNAAELPPPPAFSDLLVGMAPANPVAALGSDHPLQIIVAAILVGTAIRLSGYKADSFVAVLRSVYDVALSLLKLILPIVPIGVFALVASVVASQGFEVLRHLLSYALGVLGALGMMGAFYLLTLAALRGRPVKFLRSFYPAIFFAFGTASSAATLPISLQSARNYGLGPAVADFAIPFGAAMKRDGTATWQTFAVLFLAQFFQVPITGAFVTTLVISSVLVSFSVAGVPGTGIIALVTLLTACGVPLDGVAIVLGVDRILEGFRTAFNVFGSGVNAVLLERWEREEVGLSQRELSGDQIAS